MFFISSDNICLSNEKCIRGICRVVCNSDDACNEGHICENRICKQGCRDDNACDEDQACLNGQCKGETFERTIKYENIYYSKFCIRLTSSIAF